MYRLIAVLISFIAFFCSANDEVEIGGAGIKKIEEVARIIQENYAEDVSEEQLLEGALSGMFSSLDPYSVYINQESNNEMQIYSSGEFGGVGLELTEDKGRIKVISAIEGTPAYKAGITSGDVIYSVNGRSVYRLSPNAVINKIRGKPGTLVVLGVKSAKNSTIFTKKLTRELIKIKSVYSKLLQDNILYIRITFFGGKTAKQLEKILKIYNKKKTNLDGIILDLRNNPGGYLDQTVEVANLFLKDGVIVSTKGKNPKNFQIFKVSKADNKVPCDVTIVTLINEGSASGAEIVAGALKDHKRSVVMGKKSFGKGSVQEVIPLDNGGAISLTTALYYMPSGRSIQNFGVEPDIEVTAENKIKKDSNVGGADNEKIDYQLNQAIEYIKNKKANG